MTKQAVKLRSYEVGLRFDATLSVEAEDEKDAEGKALAEVGSMVESSRTGLEDMLSYVEVWPEGRD